MKQQQKAEQPEMIDSVGKRLNFLGWPASDARERPFGYRPGMSKSNQGGLLPATARAGLQLVSFEFARGGADPYVLYDAHGLLLHEWAEGVVPTWQDVAQVCRDLGLA